MAGTQQELGVARLELEDFHELDIEDLGDRRDDLLEQSLQIGFGQRALAEPRHDLLLLARARSSRSNFCRSVTSRQKPARRTTSPPCSTTEAIASIQRSSFPSCGARRYTT